MNAHSPFCGMLRLARVLVALILLLLAGCGGGGLNPVQGKVMSRNEPIEGALVTFHPVGADPITAVRPVGLTRKDGTFTLTTGPQEGAPAGEYVVTVIWPTTAPKKDNAIAAAEPDSRDRFDGAYADPKKSKMQVEIKKGTNQLEPFHLD